MSGNEKFDELVGQVIDKRYKVLSVIGEGGMAIVFKARDLTTDRIVAVKVLNEACDTDGHAVKRFLNESKAIAMLSNENIVKIYDVSVGRELKYIVMEYVDGQTLKSYMDEAGKKLTLEESLNYTEQILTALEHAHSKGVIHRDIKPHNMLVLKNGFLKVTDFGIAKTPSGDTISLTDKALGTVYYISPEQASGKETGTFSDIYSVGVMLYEMSTGKLPFNADTPVSVAMKQINDDPEPPTSVCPDLPKGLEQIILKAMNKDPEKRFKSAHSMLRAIKILKENPMVVFEEKTTHTTQNIPVVTPRKKSLSNGILGKILKYFPKKEATHASKDTKSGKSKVTLFPIILGMSCAFFIVLIVAGIITIASFLNNKTPPDIVTVPELKGTTYSEKVAEKLEKERFSVEVIWGEKYNDEYEYNEIYATFPEGGQTTKIQGSLKTAKLTLYVNPEEGSEPLADYSIQLVNKVKTTLKNKGYDNVVVVEESHNTVLENYVFRTEPEAGQLVKPTDTITLFVSTGKSLKKTISMPDLIGMTKGEAAVLLKDFNVEFITVANSEDMGTIVFQSIEDRTVISPEFCDKIVLYVSDGTKSENTTFYLTMPDLVGKNLGEAEELMLEIASYGIKVTYIEEYESHPAGTVFSQSVLPGESILVNYSYPIEIHYSNGQKPVENTDSDVTHPVDPTVPVDPTTPEEPTVPDEPVQDTPVTDNTDPIQDL
mgnify:CR=1 FL=1